MRLVFISSAVPHKSSTTRPGGAAWYSNILISHIPFAETDEVYYLGNMHDKPESRRLGSRIELRLCWNKGWRFLPQLIGQMKRIKPDLVHFQHELRLYGGYASSFLVFLLFLYLRLSRIKVVTTIHGVVSLRNVNQEFVRSNNSRLPTWMVKTGFYVIYKLITVLSTKIIVHGISSIRTLVDDYGLPKGKAHFIQPFVDQGLVSVPRESACRHLRLSEDKKTCLFFGFVCGYKGLDLLIDGFSLYARKNPKAFLFIAGGMNPSLKNDPTYLKYYEGLRAQAADRIPSEQYRWVGFVAEGDVPLYFGASDVCVIPYSVYMGSSGPLSLSLSYGRDLLVSDTVAELEDMNIPSIVFKRDPNSVCDILEDYFDKRLPDSKDQMRDLSLNRSIDFVAQRTYGLYRNVLGNEDVMSIKESLCR
jgi:glycosyltransferase involved in cell wall biosynthesis